jgi:hypothetical protein
MGCTRPTTQPMGSVAIPSFSSGKALSGAVGGLFAASPFTMVVGFAFGAFLAWNYVLKPSNHGGGVSGHRRRRR